MAKIGVLIIGSLYWDMQDHRSRWRRERHECGHTHVRVPIRYGRRSGTRGCSFTMVFSAGLGENQPGCGTVVPCKSQNLIEEAEYLWTAERPAGSKSNGRISASDGWGRIALLINRACPERDELCDIWSNRVCQERDVYGEPMESAVGEEAAVDESGFLNTPWPKTEDGLDLEFDALLATATNPTIIGGRYASVEEIAGAWKTPEGKRFVCYFYNNRECGITTFQDNKIEKLL